MPHQLKKLHFDLHRLKARIARYNVQIQNELKRPLPDWLRMRKLKVAKLKAKDRIARLTRRTRASIGTKLA